MTRRLSRRTVLAAAAALPAAALLPQGPARRGRLEARRQGIRIVVPAAPGGTTDIVARLLAAFLQQAWGQSCVVDNKSGAGGVIGSTEVVKATPDGHTILMGNIGPQSIAYSLYRNMPYTPKSLIAGVVRHHRAQRAGGASLGAGHDRAGVRRLAEGAERQGVLRLVGHRPVAASVGRLVPAAHRHQGRAHPLSRRGAGPAGPDGGRHPVLLRQPHHRASSSCARASCARSASPRRSAIR